MMKLAMAAVLVVCAGNVGAEMAALQDLKGLAGAEAVGAVRTPEVTAIAVIDENTDCVDDVKGKCGFRKRFESATPASATELVGEWGETAYSLPRGGWKLDALQDGKRGLTGKNFNIAPAEGDPTVFTALTDPRAKTYSELRFSTQDKPGVIEGYVTFAEGDIRVREGHSVVYECRLMGADDMICRVETRKSGKKRRLSTTYEWYARLSKTGREWPGGEG